MLNNSVKMFWVILLGITVNLFKGEVCFTEELSTSSLIIISLGFSMLPLNQSIDNNPTVLQEISIEEFLLPTETSQLEGIDDSATDSKQNITFYDLVDKYAETYGREDHTEAIFDYPIERRSVENHENEFTTEALSLYLTPAFQSVHEKENFQAHVIEQLVHSFAESGSGDNNEFTTILPEREIFQHEIIKNPEIVEIVENIVFDMKENEHHVLTTNSPNSPTKTIELQFDAIDIIPKDHHYRQHQIRFDIEAEKNENDKFVGFQPTEDLVPPGEESTEPDRFGLDGQEQIINKVEKDDEVLAEIVLETLKIVGEYGRSLQTNEKPTMSRRSTSSPKSTTLGALYQTFEDVVTTISDGITLSKELRSSINSFRDYNEEN